MDGVNSYNIDMADGGFPIVSKILNTKLESINPGDIYSFMRIFIKVFSKLYFYIFNILQSQTKLNLTKDSIWILTKLQFDSILGLPGLGFVIKMTWWLKKRT